MCRHMLYIKWSSCYSLDVGPTQGMCSCDQTCICLSGWTGRACDCDLTTDRCVSSLGVSTSINQIAINKPLVVEKFVQKVL